MGWKRRSATWTYMKPIEFPNFLTKKGEPMKVRPHQLGITPKMLARAKKLGWINESNEIDIEGDRLD